MIKDKARIKRDRKHIIELIEASWETAGKKGIHPLEPGCNCVVCVNRRKRLVDNEKNIGKYKL